MVGDYTMIAQQALIQPCLDMTSNRFGDLILEICRATNVRTVKGCLHAKLKQEFPMLIHINTNGMTMIIDDGSANISFFS